MKKTISILMALVLALSMCAMTAFAATPASLTVKSSASQAKVGDVITVTVDLSANSAIATLRFFLKYDAASVEPVGLPAYNPDASGVDAEQAAFGIVDGIFNMSTANWRENGGMSVTSITGGNGVTAGGTLFKAQFKVLKANPTFTLELAYATDKTDAEMNVSCNSVKVACAHANKNSTVTKEPTCTEAGTKTSVCADCGAALGTESIAATGHSFGAWTVVTPATCKEEGLEKRVCACGAEETRAIAKAAHTPGEWEVVKDATCTEAGEKVQKCAVCGEVLATEAIPAKGHSLADPEITKMPTCTEEGEQKGVCSVCGDEVTEAIPALGHDVTEWTIDKDADCTEDGSKHGTCNRCEEEVEEVIPAKGHDFGEWTVVKEATETEEGLKERVCSVCGEKETEVIPKLGATEADPITQPSIPKTSGAVVGSVAALAMLSMAAGVAAVTLKKKKDEEEK